MYWTPGRILLAMVLGIIVLTLAICVGSGGGILN